MITTGTFGAIFIFTIMKGIDEAEAAWEDGLYDAIDYLLEKLDESVLAVGVLHDMIRLSEIYHKRNSSTFESIIQKRASNQTLFYCIVLCDDCDEYHHVSATKTAFIKYLHNPYTPCEQCNNSRRKKLLEQNRILEIQKQQRMADAEKENRERKCQKTKNFIENYLNPNKAWKKMGYNCIRELNNEHFDVDYDKIETHIKLMNYYDFLKTPYWKAIAWEVKRKASFRCSICNSNENLATHHRTYEIHGREIDNMKELTCLCNNCHERHHDITH